MELDEEGSAAEQISARSGGSARSGRSSRRGSIAQQKMNKEQLKLDQDKMKSKIAMLRKRHKEVGEALQEENELANGPLTD